MSQTLGQIKSYLRITTQQHGAVGPTPVKNASIVVSGPEGEPISAETPSGEHRFTLPYSVGSPVTISVEAEGYSPVEATAKTFDTPDKGHTVVMKAKAAAEKEEKEPPKEESLIIPIVIGIGLLGLIAHALFFKR